MTDVLQIEKPQTALATPTEIAKDAALLGGYVYQIIQQQSKQVFKLRSQVLADTDIEDLHQMRVGTRRLRSALQLFADVIDAKSSGSGQNTSETKQASGPVKLEKAVGKLTKALGLVRDIDVMQGWLTDFTSTVDTSVEKKDMEKKDVEKKDVKEKNSTALSKKEKKTIKSLLKTLKKRRRKQFAKLEKALKGSAYKKVAKQCKQWIKQPTFGQRAEQPALSSAIDRVIDPINALLQHPGWQLATHKSKDKQRQGRAVPNETITLTELNQVLAQNAEDLHNLRKQVKQIRYQTEFFRRLYGITYAAQIREFRTLQEVLGQLQDQLVITDFLTEELGDRWPEKLPTIHQSFQNSRLKIWHQWQPLQEKYLRIAAQSTAEVAS